MKSIEKNTAIKLRKEGKTINQIAKEIGVAKSSVYNWVKETPLPLWYNSYQLHGHMSFD